MSYNQFKTAKKIFEIDSNYYIDRDDDYIDEDGIFRALQYRYTNWAQPENTTTIRQELIDVKFKFVYFQIFEHFLNIFFITNNSALFGFSHCFVRRRGCQMA